MDKLHKKGFGYFHTLYSKALQTPIMFFSSQNPGSYQTGNSSSNT
jgi:hypothetical protein